MNMPSMSPLNFKVLGVFAFIQAFDRLQLSQRAEGQLFLMSRNVTFQFEVRAMIVCIVEILT